MYFYISIAIATIVALYLGRLWFVGRTCRLTNRIDGKIVVVTGANTGIGKETVKALAERGARVILAVRDIRRGEQAKAEIEDSFRQSKTQFLPIIVLQLDLNDLRSVEKFVDLFKETNLGHIDILMNNAGVMATQTRELTKQGIEQQFGVNHIGHFHLTNLLIPFLRKANKARIINVASSAHQLAKFDFSDLNFDKDVGTTRWELYRNMVAYGNSKLANILHAKELTKRLAGDGIVAVSLHPGAVKTELQRHAKAGKIMGKIVALSGWLINYTFKSPTQGAQTQIYLSLLEHEKLVPGGYYNDLRLETPRGATSELQAKVWEVSERLVAETKDK